MPNETSTPNLADRVANSWRNVEIHAAGKVTETLSTMRDRQAYATRSWISHHLIAENLLPQEITEYNNAIEEALQIKKNGGSFIVTYNHYSKRDPVDALNFLTNIDEEFAQAPYIGPLAIHQSKPYITAASKLTDIPLIEIVTKDTIELGKNFQKQPIKQHAVDIYKKITHQEMEDAQRLPDRYGLNEYINDASDILTQGGIVFVAPQGGRRNSLGSSPSGRGIEMLVNAAERKGADNVYIWPLGILLQNSVVFDETTQGFNLGEPVDITVGIPVSVAEYRHMAKEQKRDGKSLTIDQVNFNDTAELVHYNYIKEKSDKKLPTDEQEAQSQV